MSVGGVENKRSTEVDARNKQEATRKEVETAKRHAATINRLRQEQYDKIQELQSQQQEALGQQREAFQASLSERDMQYQKDVEELREMNRQRLMTTASAHEEKLARSREANQAEVESQKRINQQQKKVLTETFGTELTAKDKQFREAMEQTKDMQKRGMEHDREGMQNSFEKRTNILRETYNDHLDSKSDQMRELRRAKAVQEKDLKAEVFRTKDNMSDTFSYQLGRERKENNEQSTAARDAYSAALESQRERQKEALMEEQDRARANYEDFANGAGSRQENRIKHLERKLMEARDTSVDRLLENKRLSDLEKKHLLSGMKNNLDASEQQRQLALEDGRQKNSQEIKKVVEQNAKTLHIMDMNAKDSASLNKAKSDEELSQVKIAMTDQQDKLKNQSEMRYRKMAENFINQQSVVQDNYKGNLEEMKKAYDEALVETRVNSQNERNSVIERMTKQSRAIEQKAFERMQLQSANYERKIAELQTNHSKELTLARRENETRVKNDRSLSQQELANMKMKYETQITEIKDGYEKRIREMQQSHEMEKIKVAKNTT